MEIKEFKSEEKQEWDQFVNKNKYSNVLQSWEWGEVKRSDEWKLIRLGVFHDEKQICAALILERNLPLHFKLYYSPYGPVIDWEMPYAEDILKTIHNYLKEKADNRYLFWKIEPPVTEELSENYKVKDVLNRLGFKKSTHSIQPQYTTIIDLSKSEKDILSSFEKDTRYSIRRAEREKVEVKEYKNPLNDQPIKEFYALYTKTTKRGKFPARSYMQFERIWSEMAPDKARCYQAWYKDELLASSIVLTLGNKSYLVYAGSIRSEKHKNKFPTYILQWEAIKHLKRDGYKHYDMWGIIPNSVKNHPWAGISLFKRGFRGTETSYIGSYDLPLSPFYNIFQLVNNLRYKFNRN